MEDLGIYQAAPPILRGEVRIYSNILTFWGYWQLRQVTLDKGLFTIFEKEHLTEISSNYLTGFTISQDKVYNWTDNSRQCQLRLQSKSGILSSGTSIVLLFKSTEEMKSWETLITRHINYANIVYGSNIAEAYSQPHPVDLMNPEMKIKSLFEPPQTLRGWLYKQGHIVPSWRRRFFILERGELSYYVRHTKEKPYEGIRKKGSLKLWNFMTSSTVMVGKIYLCTDSISDPASSINGPPYVMLLYADSEKEIKKWVFALNVHCHYGRYLVMAHRKVLLENAYRNSLNFDSLSELNPGQLRDSPNKLTSPESSTHNDIVPDQGIELRDPQQGSSEDLKPLEVDEEKDVDEADESEANSPCDDDNGNGGAYSDIDESVVENASDNIPTAYQTSEDDELLHVKEMSI